MNASLEEVRQAAQELLDLMGIRMRAGQVIFHIGDFQVQSVDLNQRGIERRFPQKALDRARTDS